MNKIILSSAILATMAANAHAAPDAAYAGAITATNIGVIHHAISVAAMGAFDHPIRHVGIVPQRPAPRPTPQTQHEDYRKMYGTMPIYGTMPLYGEYGDDGTVFTTGRSGGDTPTQLNTWALGQYMSDRENFKHFDKTDNKYALIMAGISGNRTKLTTGNMMIGAFGGYVGGDTDNHSAKQDTNGGYLGAYATYSANRLHIAATATIGKMFNDISKPYGDDYDNTWFGVTADANYDLYIDPTFTIQPGLRIAYTSASTDNFTTIGDTGVKTKDMAMFELTPVLRAIKHIADGWFLNLDAKYVMRHNSGGNVYASGQKLSHLSVKNYAEYGIGLEKMFGTLNIGGQIIRHDIGRDGWGAMINIKYAF